MNLHIYRSRHLFIADDYVGTFDHLARSVHLLAAFADHKNTVKAWFARTQGISLMSVTAGEEVAAVVMAPQEFPAEIVARMDPYLGHRTPEAVDYARKHFTREEFDTRYQGVLAYETDMVEPADVDSTEPPAVPPAKKRGRKPKAQILSR